jgi:3-phosphoshikimate 1-carboxyvinyltransferase
MNIRINKPIKGGTIKAIASKSEAHRLLICSALSDGETFVTCSERSADIDATADCLKALGADIRYEEDGFNVTPINRKAERQTDKKLVLDCGESGSTLRFLLPVCGALGLAVSIKMSGRLPMRPISALYDEMASHGCTLSEQGCSPLYCAGQLQSGSYTLPGNISSQYISGLLFALPLLSGDSSIHVTGVLESRPYLDMTLDALRLFGININEHDTCFNITGTAYRSPKSVRVEGDWSNAAFWLSAGAIGDNAITCTGLNLHSRQGDKAIIDFLRRFGAIVTADTETVTVKPGKLIGIDIDAGDTPDLVPILSAVAAVAEGKTIIRNAGRLRIKESNRLQAITASLSGLGANITETSDGLVIIGKKNLNGGETPSFGDHRIAMTAAIVSAVCSKTVFIKNAEAVNKSYPGFFKDFNTMLGGECTVTG